MKIGDRVKIKNPSLNYQKELVYTILKVNKTTLHVRLDDIIYKGILKSSMKIVT